MSYRLIRGTFHVVGYKPDGDSIRFKADHQSDWNRFGRLKKNRKHHVQLRLQGIDTPETHVSNIYHQPLELAFSARDRLLNLLKIKNVQLGSSQHTIISAQDDTRGTLLVSGSATQRPISFVFAGDRFSDVNTGTLYTPTHAQIRSSVNYKIVDEGHAYPLFYRGMNIEFREDFTDAAIESYNADRGLWPYDWSEEFSADNLVQLEEEYCVFPKIFRAGWSNT